MLLGIPGDNTYSNYAEAIRAFYRQTVMPLISRIASALGSWLGAQVIFALSSRASKSRNWIMAIVAVLLLSANVAMANAGCDFVKVAEEYVAKHYPRSDVSGLQRVLETADRWRVTWDLPFGTIGGTPDIEIDRQTCRVVNAVHWQ